MLEILQNIFTSNQFIPHGHCYLWKPGLVGLNILSDSLIALAYYSIPLLLVTIVRKRGDLPFDWIFILFGTFIVACGTGHLLEIWTLWHPIYWISGLVKALTALVSVATGIVLMSLIPKILTLPSPAQLEEANRKLGKEVKERYLVEEKLQLAMDNIPQFVFWKDRNSVYQGCNRNFALAAGLNNPEDIMGLTDYELAWKREESDLIRQCDARVMEADTAEYHVIETQLRADGTEVWVDTNKVPIHNAEGNVIGILGTYEDITARKLAEEELQATVAELRALFAAMSDVILVMDAKGSYLKIAPTNPSLLYKPPAELLGKTVHEVFPQAEADACLGNIRRALENWQTVNTEYSMIIGDKEYWFANSISPIQEDSVIFVARDITERKILEKELAMREQLLNSFITAAPVGMCILDDQLRYLQINEALAETIYGLDVERFIGRPIGEVIPHVVSVIEPIYRRILTTGESVLNVEGCSEKADQPGVMCHWVASQFAIPGEDGKPMAIGAIVADISDRKRAENALRQSETELREKNQQLEHTLQELQRTQEQLIQSEKMSSLGQLVAGVAHEINNPISFIYGNLTHVSEYAQELVSLVHLYQQHYPQPSAEIQTLSEELDLDFLAQDFPKILSSMKNGATRIREIVLSLRNFSRLDEAEVKAVNIHEGIDNTLLILQNRLHSQARAWEKGARHAEIKIIKEYGKLPPVKCYAGQLNQVFLNILTNAIDALDMKAGDWGLGTGDKGLSKSPSNPQSPIPNPQSPIPNPQSPIPEIRISTEFQGNDWVVVRIADNGCGMTQEVQRRLFDPFFTTKPVGKGTGLGLSISYQIVKKHGGILQCVSTPTQGAEFAIRIPIQQKVGIGNC